MVDVQTNIGKASQVIITGLKKLANPSDMLRTASTTVLALMKVRIHQDGLDADGNQIGTYSKGYMAVRTGVYGNAKTFQKGKNAGKVKNAGVFTKGKNKGAPRPKFNRTASTKVVFSLTREMENDMKVVAIGPNSYGIGFSNKHNYDKSQWVEATYNKKGKVYTLSQGEIQAVEEIAVKFTEDALPE